MKSLKFLVGLPLRLSFQTRKIRTVCRVLHVLLQGAVKQHVHDKLSQAETSEKI